MTALRTDTITYEARGTRLEGYVARPADAPAPLPGVLVVHEWWGNGDYPKRRARDVAELGHVALAVDMYGEGRTVDDPDAAGACMNEIMGDPELLEARFRAALETLHGLEGVDANRTAAIGYCMGGGIVLNMARLGVGLDAVVSFHGVLNTGVRATAAVGDTRILVLTGEDDPMAGPDEVRKFEDEMKAAGARYEVVSYPGVVHAFTNPEATETGERFDLPLRYDADADADSWARMKALLAEAL